MDIQLVRKQHPNVKVLAHPECSPEVIAASDYSGSTAAMIEYVEKKRPARVMMVTECSMAGNVAAQYPSIDFVQPCRFCPHMNRITLPKIRRALETMTHEVTIDPALAARARLPIERMLAIG